MQCRFTKCNGSLPDRHWKYGNVGTRTTSQKILTSGITDQFHDRRWKVNHGGTAPTGQNFNKRQMSLRPMLKSEPWLHWNWQEKNNVRLFTRPALKVAVLLLYWWSYFWTGGFCKPPLKLIHEHTPPCLHFSASLNKSNKTIIWYKCFWNFVTFLP